MIANSASLLFKIDADSSNFKREMQAVDASIGRLGSQFSTFAGVATVGAAAIAGVATSAIAGATALFNFTKQSADFGSELYDASIRTGLTAASISALKVAAEGSGSSLEAMSGSVAKFNVLVGQAAQGNEKAAETLKRYGITATDTNEAFEQAIAVIGRMTTQEQKAIASKELFKDKTGQMLPLVDQVNGKYKEYTETMRKLAVTLTEEDLKAADDFGDTLGVLGLQAKIAGVKFASELMPMVTGAMSNISKFMSENQGVAREWGQVVVTMVQGVGVAFDGLKFIGTAALDALTLGMWRMLGDAQRWGISMKDILLSVVTPIYALGQLFGKKVVGGPLTITDPSLLKGPSLGGPSGGGKGGGGGSAKSDAEQKAREELQAQIQGQQFALRKLEKDYKDTMKRIQEAFKKSGDTTVFNEQATAAQNKLMQGAMDILALLDELERKALKDPTPTKSKNLSNDQGARRSGFGLMTEEDVEENGELIKAAVQKIFDDLKTISEKNAEDIHDALVEGGLADAEQAAERYKQLLTSGRTKNKAVQAEMAASLKTLAKNYRVLTDEQDNYFEKQVDGLEDWRQKEEEKAKKTITDADELQSALDQINNEYARRLELLVAIDEQERKKIKEKTGVPVTPGADYNFDFAGIWGDFVKSIMDDGPTIKETLLEIGKVGLTAFKQMAEGIGSMVGAWVLYGTAGPNAMRKMVASVLAGVAAQSAVLAVFELAKGFASLFFNPAEAAAHFKAAGLFASIAAGTGLSGRAVAGDAFNQQAGGSSSGGTGDGSAGQPERLNFTETFNGFTQEIRSFVGAATDRMNEVAGGVRDQFEIFNQKFGTASSTDVVMAGAGGAGEAIFGAVNDHLGSDLRASSDLVRVTGNMKS